ncbi:unnamed protein product [Ascophyllum nodosum]
MSAAVNPEEGLDANERIAIVDEATNEVVGSARRAEMRRDNLPHRATYVFIQCPGGDSATNPDLWVQKRTMIKDYCPGYLDPSTGGVVGHGETYADNARRELEEEMGVTAKPETVTLVSAGGGGGGREEGVLRHCFSFHYKDHHTNVWGDAWDCVWGGKIVPQPVRDHPLLKIDRFFFSNDHQLKDTGTHRTLMSIYIARGINVKTVTWEHWLQGAPAEQGSIV